MINKEVYKYIMSMREKNIYFSLESGRLVTSTKYSDIEMEKKDIDYIRKNKQDIIKTLWFIEKRDGTSIPELNESDYDKDLPVSFQQRRLLITDSISENGSEYNSIEFIRLRGNLNIKRFVSAIRSIIADTEIFRTVYCRNGDDYTQRVRNSNSLDEYINLHYVKEERQVKLFLDEEINHRFNLFIEIPLRVKILCVSENVCYVIFNFHHICWDAQTSNIFFSRLTAIYNGDDFKSEINSYREYSNWQRNLLKDDILDSILNFWNNKLTRDSYSSNLPFDYKDRKSKTSDTVEHFFTNKLNNVVKKLSKKNNVTPYIIYETALVLLIHIFSDATFVTTGSPYFNRETLNFQNTIGFFVNMLIIDQEVSGEDTVREFIRKVIVINFVIHHIAIDELTKLKLFESLFYDGEVLTNISLYPSLKKESFKKENEFWKNYLNKSYSINFSTDFNRNPINNHLGNRVYSKIENFSDILEKKSRYLKVSEFSFLYTITAICFQVIMEDSPLIGIPSNNRNLYKVNPNELGYYVQVVPTIFEFPSNNAFAEVVKSTHDMLQQLLLNQTPDLNDIMKNTRIDDSFTDSICPIMMTYENNSLEHDNLEELMVFNDFSQNDITVLYKKNKNDLQIVIEYNETIYRRSTILAIENMLKTIINNIEANLFANINDINLTTQVQLPQPKNNLHESQIASISELVNKSFEQNSSRIALERGDSFITYEELKNLSDKVMAIIYNIFLNKMDFKQTVLVYCCSDFESIIVIISLLRLGINFCCITKETPKERIKKIVEICQSQYCITMKDEVSEFYSDFNLEVINPSNIDFDYKLASSSFDSHSVREDDLAYTIFTSGSTGEPKAIDISQVSLSYHILSAIQTYDIDYSSKILQISSITFDVAMSDILCSIVSGGSLVLIEESMHYNPRKISEIISKNEITHINCTPTFLKSLNKDDLSNLKIINLGGEVASKSLIEEWRDKVQLFISYGPSECTICTSAVSVNENTHHSTIGYPIGYNKYYVCDKNGRILPSGIPGYLFITGPQLMRGYRGIASGLTHLRFNEEMILAFNTGDIVKLEEDLSYTFIERSGSLTKINGNRISLKEIDYELEKCHNIMNAATIIHKNELCSFIVSDELVNFEEISNSLSLVLPMYMIPQNYFCIEKIPITVSGKVNYKSLQQLIENKEFEVRKLTYTENELMLIWKDILNFEGKILPNTSFYEIGGNSLYYSILINHIFKKWNVMIEIHQIASLRTLSRISNFIDINKITVLETEQDFKGKYNEHIW